jgi:hypothetical protein
MYLQCSECPFPYQERAFLFHWSIGFTHLGSVMVRVIFWNGKAIEYPNCRVVVLPVPE